MSCWRGLIALILLPGCGLSFAADEYAAPEPLGTIHDRRITEASGIAASRRNPGLFYIHNDSGDAAQVFVIDRKGNVRATIRVLNAENRDWEDIALAPAKEPGAFDVCVADIGDNDARRSEVVIYHFAEPELPAGKDARVDVKATAVRLRYEDGPRDAEAFCVHPTSGAGYLITKHIDGDAEVYKLPAPWKSDEVNTLKKIASVALPAPVPIGRAATAADIRPDGHRLAIRTYSAIWEWRLPGDSATDFDRIFREAPVLLPAPPERQGEALTYSHDGEALLTVSEGREPTLWELRGMPPATQPDH
jgi:hypothetical protein